MDVIGELLPCAVNDKYCPVAVTVAEALTEFDTPQEWKRTISDPLPIIRKVCDHLSDKPCEYTKTGLCEAASFLTQLALKQRTKG